MRFGSDSCRQARCKALFPAAVVLTVEIVRVDIDAGGEVIFCQIHCCLRLDADPVPASAAGRARRFLAHPAHGTTTGCSKYAGQEKSQSQFLHHFTLSMRHGIQSSLLAFNSCGVIPSAAFALKDCARINRLDLSSGALIARSLGMRGLFSCAVTAASFA